MRESPKVIKEFMYRGTKHRLVKLERNAYAHGDYHYTYAVDKLGTDSAGDPAWHKVSTFTALPDTNEGYLLRAMEAPV